MKNPIRNTNKVIVESFSFDQFESDSIKNADSFDFEEFTASDRSGKKVPSKVIKSDSDAERSTNFHMASLVKKHRGILSLRKEEDNDKINQKVDARLKKISKDAYDRGIEQGKEESYEEAFEKSYEVFEQEVESFKKYVEDFKAKSEEIYTKNRQNAYDIIKNLTKWIVLKEVKDDDKYIERLLEKLIYEINTKNNLIIRVNNKDFPHMEEAIKEVEKRIGQLKNCRVEMDLDMQEKGIILETENVILDGSYESQMESIDSLFKSVDLYDE
ncbi:FliH/SctL family protein [Bacteriovoracaceae bacterium]|nr:FliH/SctL family protein [Bacteriovoracaceae bacterium]